MKAARSRTFFVEDLRLLEVRMTAPGISSAFDMPGLDMQVVGHTEDRPSIVTTSSIAMVHIFTCTLFRTADSMRKMRRIIVLDEITFALGITNSHTTHGGRSDRYGAIRVGWFGV